MTPSTALTMLAQMHEDLPAGVGSMTIPVELTEAILAVWDDQETEYATEGPADASKGKRLRPEDSWMRRINPLAKWIHDSQRYGGRVYRRRIITVESWELLTEGARS